MSRLPAAALVLGLPVGLVAAIDRLGESPAGLAAGVAALFGALSIVGLVRRRLGWLAARRTRSPQGGRSIGRCTERERADGLRPARHRVSAPGPAISVEAPVAAGAGPGARTRRPFEA